MPVKWHQWSRMIVGRSLTFSVILQSLCALPTIIKATPQLTLTSATTRQYPRQERQKGSLLQKQLLSKIFRQIQKSGRKAIAGGSQSDAWKELARRYLINWSEGDRHLSPFVPLVSLELDRFENGKVGENRKSPAVIHWGKLRKIVAKMQKNTWKITFMVRLINIGRTLVRLSWMSLCWGCWRGCPCVEDLSLISESYLMFVTFLTPAPFPEQNLTQ